MRKYDANTWHAAEGEFTSNLAPYVHVTLTVSGAKTVEVFGLSGDQAVLLTSGQEFSWKARLTDFEAIRLVCPVHFGFKLDWHELQRGEPINDENPPAPPLPGADNLVAQVRRIMLAEQERMRGAVLDPEDSFPFGHRYTIDDDDERFEEDIGAEILENRRQKAAEPPPEPKPKADGPLTVSPEPAPEEPSDSS